MSGVTIVACSDLHGIASFYRVADVARSEEAKIIVVAGDVQTAFAGRDSRHCFAEDILRPVYGLMKEGVEIVLTPGNHDFHLHQCLESTNRKQFTSNLHILCDKMEKILDLKFYGTPWVPMINGRWCYEADDDNLAIPFSRIPNKLDVLVSHSPPRGADGELFDVSTGDSMANLEHYGSVTLGKAIADKKPRLVICGHIHTGDHQVYRIGETLLVNVSLIDENYREAYAPTVIRIDENGKIKFKIGEENEWKNYQS